MATPTTHPHPSYPPLCRQIVTILTIMMTICQYIEVNAVGVREYLPFLRAAGPRVAAFLLSLWVREPGRRTRNGGVELYEFRRGQRAGK
jgi:hypothetical protein